MKYDERKSGLSFLGELPAKLQNGLPAFSSLSSEQGVTEFTPTCPETQDQIESQDVKRERMKTDLNI